MSNTNSAIKNLFSTLKSELKARSITYKGLSDSLGISESSVKRWFSQERITVEQLGLIANCLGLSFSELLQKTDDAPIEQLSHTQEAQITENKLLFLVYVCIFDNWTINEIIKTYNITEIECLKFLLILDRLRLIDLLPRNRIRTRVSRNFNWLPGGPLEEFFTDELLPDFLDSSFNGEYDDRLYMRARLTPTAIVQLQSELQQLRKRIAELHQESLKAPASQRRTMTTFIAQREWEPKDFQAMRRDAPTDLPIFADDSRVAAEVED